MNIETLYRWRCEALELIGTLCETVAEVERVSSRPLGWHLVDGRGICPAHEVFVRPRGEMAP